MGKYEEALERAKSFIERGGEYDRQVMEYIFPELKESEDERVRKAINNMLPFIPDEAYANNGVTKEGVLNWLEKQKPAEWSEDYREEDIQTRFAFYTYKDDPSVLYLSNVFVEETSRNHGFGTRILKATEKAAEAIGAITICLKVKQDSPANAWYRKHGYGYVTFEDGYDWLEKNLEYLKPAKSAEWSEEDESKKERLISIVKRALHGNEYPILNDDGATELITWLKSLRPSWKPSEEQPEVDLEKEFDGFLNKKEGVPRMWHSDEQIEWAKDIARHFYELGLNARKEE